MWSLALQVLFSAGFGLAVKRARLRGSNVIVVGGLNYIFAAVFATIWVAAKQNLVFGMPGVVFGSINGIVYFFTYFLLIYAMHHHGLAATTAVGQVALVVPILASVVLWSEYPSTLQIVGIVITMGTVVLLDARKDALVGVDKMLRLVLVLFFIAGGGVRVVAKLFAELHVPEQRPFYVWIVFVSSGLLSVLLLIREGKFPTPAEWAYGAFVGMCNVVQIIFFLTALAELPGIIVFPVSSCGHLIVTTTVAVALMGERPTRKMYWGIGLSAVAVILLNWRLPGR
ncbi:MAG: hypothetical protein O3A46_04920 [Candidatus Poribacteria bacterium]|nr:hypothetical protein [Candidatus Poribacteria bacterium]